MKITGIEIGEYRQFKNIKFDFTYPADHERAGEPLDKVCFIGQSGTGKTTLLNIIWDFFRILNISRDVSLQDFDTIPSDITFYEKFKSILVNIQFHQTATSRPNFSLENHDFTDLDKSKTIGYAFTLLQELGIIDNIKNLFRYTISVFIKDSVARDADAFLIEQTGQDSISGGLIKTEIQVEKDKEKRKETINNVGNKKLIILGDGESLPIWRYLLKDIYEYDEESQEQAISIMQKTGKISVDDLIKKLSELNQWKASTPNPRLELAQKCLNPILSKFYVDVDTESGKVPITLKTKGGVKIDTSTISTGIRQILATAIPIFKIFTHETVILFDEPERSLFPDVQRELVDYYISLAPTAQFFFATHSPIIAASFEPCERFILDFNENGEVICRNGIAPEGDDPNDVLRKDFGMSPLMNEEGIRQYEHYRNLAVRIREETDENEKNRLIAERVELGNRYNFAGQYASNQ